MRGLGHYFYSGLKLFLNSSGTSLTGHTSLLGTLGESMITLREGSERVIMSSFLSKTIESENVMSV